MAFVQLYEPQPEAVVRRGRGSRRVHGRCPRCLQLSVMAESPLKLGAFEGIGIYDWAEGSLRIWKIMDFASLFLLEFSHAHQAPVIRPGPEIRQVLKSIEY